jgi:integrase
MQRNVSAVNHFFVQNTHGVYIMETLLTIRDLQDLLRVSEATLRRWLAEARKGTGDFPKPVNGFKRKLLFRPVDVEAWAGYQRQYYVKNGQQTETFDHYRRAVAAWVKHYGNESVDAFVPLSLVFLQKQWVEKEYARLTVNRYVGIIKQAFKHGVKYGWVDAHTHFALQAVDNLKAGRTKAPEPRQVKPVADAVVDKTLPFLQPIVADMVRVQRLCGMRPQDVRNMRSCDIDQSGDVWKYTPFTHKTEHQGKKRAVPVGMSSVATTHWKINLRNYRSANAHAGIVGTPFGVSSLAASPFIS